MASMQPITQSVPLADGSGQTTTQITTKPGRTTSEFYQAVAAQLVAAVVAAVSLLRDGTSDGPHALVPAIAAFASALVTAAYSRSRAQVKASAYSALTATEPAQSRVVPTGQPGQFRKVS